MRVIVAASAVYTLQSSVIAMRDETLNAIYDVLVEECGANDTPDERDSFRRCWPACIEYRFVGELGMGGKIWASRRTQTVRVTCYAEDETPERSAAIKRANDRITELVLDA